MDFFDKQELARKRTRWLVIYFFLAVVGIILALHTAFCMALGQRWDDLPLLGITAAGVLLAVLIGSLVKIAELSQGGKVVAKMLGGTLVEQGSADSEERRLLNVVEEMALASGVPVPEVYVLEEDAINAFAAGFGTSDAVVGVTRGCLRQLTRDELQGVIGHEFSHILNGDMRLNIRLMGLLNGILFLAIMGGILFRIAASSQPRSRSSDNKNGGSITAALFVAGIAHRRPLRRRHCALHRGVDRGVFRQAHQGGGEPSARVSRRCLCGAVHSQPGWSCWRAAENRPAHIEVRKPESRGSQSSVFWKRTRRALAEPLCHTSSDRGSHRPDCSAFRSLSHRTNTAAASCHRTGGTSRSGRCFHVGGVTGFFPHRPP